MEFVWEKPELSFKGTTYQAKLSSQIMAVLTILSHPEMVLHTAGLATSLLLVSHKRQDLLRALAIAGGIIVLTSPWWGTVLASYGMEPFLQASKLSGRDFLWIAQQLLFLQLSGEEIFPIIGMLGLLGFGLLFARREYLLGMLIVIPYVVNQRNAGTVAVVFLCIFASTALIDLILPGLAHWKVYRCRNRVRHLCRCAPAAGCVS